MGNVTYERLDAMVTPKIYPQISLTPVLEHEGDFVRLHHIDMEWPVGEGVEKYVPIRYVSKHVARVLDLETENAELRELVRCLVYATSPLDRATLIANAAELGGWTDE